jgi:hypothetical protein
LKHAAILACVTTLFAPPACSEEWFEKSDASKCRGTVQVCLSEPRALGWRFAGPTDELQSRSVQGNEIWAKDRKMIACRWLKDGTQDVSCEMTTFDD